MYKKTYTRGKYDRGAMRTRDFIYESFICPKCEICGKDILRKVYKNGSIQRLERWLLAKTCKVDWDKNRGEYPPNLCYKKWRAIPKNNPNYKGISKRRCPKCGGVFSHYVKKTKTCIKCRSKRG